MKIKFEISDIDETVKLIKKITSLTADMEKALWELKACPTFGNFEIKENNK